MRRTPRVTALLVGICLAVSLSGANANPSGTTFEQPAEFRDLTNGVTLAVQLQADRADTGQFDLVVPGRGDYDGTVMLGRTSDERSQTLDPRSGEGSDGNSHTGRISVKGEIPVQFLPEDGSPPTMVKIELNGYVDNLEGTASVEIRTPEAPRDHHVLKQEPADARQAAQMARKVLAVMVSQDWGGMYGLLAADVKDGFTKDQFVTMMASQAVSQVLTAATLGATGQVTRQAGFAYYTQPISVVARSAGGTPVSFNTNMYLVQDQLGWRFLTTDAMPTT